MKNLKIKSLAAALIASTIITTALPVCAADMDSSNQTTVSAEAAVDYTTENGVRVIQDSNATAYVYEGGKSGVIIVEDPESLWSDELGFCKIGDVDLCNIINYNNGYVNKICRYDYDEEEGWSFFYHRICTYGYAGTGFQRLSLKFMDEEYDIYSLSYNDNWNPFQYSSNRHDVEYNSEKPKIVRIQWEFTGC